MKNWIPDKRMETLEHHSTRALCSRRGDVFLADYRGPLNASAFEELRPRVVRSSGGAQCLVLRMDKALSLMASAPAVGGYAIGSLPGAVIVRPDQYAIWIDYAVAMSAVGITRVVFPTSELLLCREWVDLQLELALHQ